MARWDHARRIYRDRVGRKAGCLSTLPPGKLDALPRHPGFRCQVAQRGGSGSQTQPTADAGILLVGVAAGDARPRVLPAARAAAVVGGLDQTGVLLRSPLLSPMSWTVSGDRDDHSVRADPSDSQVPRPSGAGATHRTRADLPGALLRSLNRQTHLCLPRIPGTPVRLFCP